MSFAIRNSTRPSHLHYRDEGRGAAVVLVHGWPLSLEIWNPQANALRTTCRVIRMDRRGFGTNGGAPSLSGDVRDLLSLFERLNLRNAALVGMSQGARVAMRAMPQLTDRVSCLVLDGAPLDDGNAGPAESEVPIEAMRQLVATRGVEAFRTEWLAHPLMRLHEPTAESTALLKNILSNYSAADLADFEARNEENPFGPVAPGDISVPTLVLNGEHDTNRRRLGDALYAALPDAQRAIIAGAGHLPNLDKPREYNAELTRFTEQHGRTAI